MSNPFTQGQQLFNDHKSYIEKKARSLAYSYVKVEAEDVVQEVWLFLWEKEAAFLERQCSEAYIKACINNVALNYAQRVRDSTFLETNAFFYSVDEVKELVEQFINGGITRMPDTWDTWTKGDSLEVWADLSSAWDRLSDGQKGALAAKYGRDEELDPAQRQALSRALKKFTSILNNSKNQEAREYEGTGTRKPVGRTAATAAVAV